MLVKYWFVSVISVKYRFTQISTLMIFNRYLTDTNQYILETNIIGKIGEVLVKYRFIPFSILVRFNQYLTNTYRYILKSNIIG